MSGSKPLPVLLTITMGIFVTLTDCNPGNQEAGLAAPTAGSVMSEVDCEKRLPAAGGVNEVEVYVPTEIKVEVDARCLKPGPHTGFIKLASDYGLTMIPVTANLTLPNHRTSMGEVSYEWITPPPDVLDAGQTVELRARVSGVGRSGWVVLLYSLSPIKLEEPVTLVIWPLAHLFGVTP